MDNDGIAEYRCENCDEIWEFFPEDYNSPDDWPILCPMCVMPVSQLIRDSYQAGGIWEVVYRLKIRFL